MLRRPLFRLLLALALAAAFVAGLAQLFILRYQVGDIYPEYSSLRADPLGTMALASALDTLPGVEVQRNFKYLPKMRPKGPVTLVYAGVDHRSEWTNDELTVFNELVVDGTRAVFAFDPVIHPPTPRQETLAREVERDKKKKQVEEQERRGKSRGDKKKDKEKSADGAQKTDDGADKKDDAGAKREAGDSPEKKTDTGEKKKSGQPSGDGIFPRDKKKAFRDTEGEDHSLISFTEVAKRWGLSFGYLPEEKDKDKLRDRRATLVDPASHLEPDISWHSFLYFKDPKPQWKVLYKCGQLPVVIERQVGKGSILLAADSYFMSNEAMRVERDPLLLARVFSGPSPIVFDEDHNNLRENPGIASLARKYRLHGVAAGLALLAILFVWKNMVRFVPAYAASAGPGDEVAGKDSGEGFVNLLRRSIRPSAIFGVCLGEWRKSFSGRPRELARAEEIGAREETRPPGQRDPVATYREISRALTRKV